MRYLIYADGSYHDKISDGSFAVYWLGNDECLDLVHRQLRTEQPVHISRRILFQYQNKKSTNNFAEASTLQASLIWCCANNVFEQDIETHICMDSQLVLAQFIGVAKVNCKHLRTIYSAIYNLLETKSKQIDKDVLSMLHFHWISGKIMKSSIIGH